MIDQSQSLRDNVWTENCREPRRYGLVMVRRRRCHEELAAHDLVLVAVVGKSVHLFDRPRLGGHVHDPSLLGALVDAGMAEDHMRAPRTRHRIPPGKIAVTPARAARRGYARPSRRVKEAQQQQKRSARRSVFHSNQSSTNAVSRSRQPQRLAAAFTRQPSAGAVSENREPPAASRRRQIFNRTR